MKDEIKEILDDLLFTTTLPNVSVKLSEEKLYQLKDYITNLQEENERLKEDIKIKDKTISITYNKDTKEYILDRKNYYKINKKLKERIDLKSSNIYLSETCDKYKMEVEQLNNIIDELSKWLIIKSNDNYKYTEYDEVLNKLNELKGDNKYDRESNFK